VLRFAAVVQVLHFLLFDASSAVAHPLIHVLAVVITYPSEQVAHVPAASNVPSVPHP
jgi:hypothetical protein